MATQFHPVLFAVAILPAAVWLTGCSQPDSTATAADAASSSTAASTSTPAPESPSAASTETPPTTPSALVEGRDYTVIKTPLNVEKPDQIEVREFFWYGCSHCYALEPSLNNWLATKPVDVNFIRTPAALNPVWEQNARAYYTVEGMGKMTNALHDQLFNTIHQQQKQLFDQPALADFYSKAGVDAVAFNAGYNSFAVTTKVNQSKQLAQRAGLSGVPALVVNGRYLVSGEPQQMISTVNGLIAQERQAAAAAAP